MNKRSTILTAVSACLLVLTAWIGTFSSGVPNFRSPMPLLVVISTVLFDNFFHIAVVWVPVFVPSVLFLIWNPALFEGKKQIPARSLVLLVLSTGLTILYFIFGWRDGVGFQGGGYTRAICIMNSFWLGLLWLLLWRAFKNPSFAGNLLFHWILFAWLSWYAFPFLGELP